MYPNPAPRSARAMLWASERQRMEAALRDLVVPRLRAIGFQGSFPELHRLRDGGVDFFQFQFSTYGPTFAVNVGSARPPVDPRKIPRAEFYARLVHCATGADDWFDYKLLEQPTVGRDGLVRFAELNTQLPFPTGDEWDRARRRDAEHELLARMGDDLYRFQAERVLEFLSAAENWWRAPYERRPPAPAP